MTPSARFSRRVSSRAFCAFIWAMVCSRCPAVWFSAAATSSSSSPVRTRMRLERSPDENSSAAFRISSRGWVTWRARIAVPPSIRKNAANPVPQVMARTRFSLCSRLVADIDARTTPAIRPSDRTGTAQYRWSFFTEMLRRCEKPTRPASASLTSGWFAWFSSSARCADPTSESAATTPSGRTTVSRVSRSFESLSPSRAIRSRSGFGAVRSGRNASAARRACFFRLASASSVTYRLNWRYPAIPAKARAAPVITK